MQEVLSSDPISVTPQSRVGTAAQNVRGNCNSGAWRWILIPIGTKKLVEYLITNSYK